MPSLKIGTEAFYYGRRVQVESVVQNRGRVYVRGVDDGPQFSGWVDVVDLKDQADAMVWVGLAKTDVEALIRLLEAGAGWADCVTRLKKAIGKET